VNAESEGRKNILEQEERRETRNENKNIKGQTQLTRAGKKY
jgi:hypothetical protein